MFPTQRDEMAEGIGRPSKIVRISWLCYYKQFLSIPLYSNRWSELFEAHIVCCLPSVMRWDGGRFDPCWSLRYEVGTSIRIKSLAIGPSRRSNLNSGNIIIQFHKLVEKNLIKSYVISNFPTIILKVRMEGRVTARNSFFSIWIIEYEYKDIL